MTGYVSPSLAFGDPVRPFTSSFWGTRLPDNATIDPNSAAIVADLVTQSGLAAPTLNIAGWTAEPVVVPASQPLVPVTLNSTDGILKAVLALGVPIPAGWQPTNDNPNWPTSGTYPDWEGSFWQPDWVSPHNAAWIGRYYELYHASRDANGNWSCGGGARMINVNPTTRPHFNNVGDPNYATDPDSSYCSAAWGAQGSGLPLMPGTLSLKDCQRGYVDHALMLEVVNARASQVWPAQRNDGQVHTVGQNGYVVLEGQRLRFPPGYQIPAGASYLQRLIVQAVRDYGCCITDKGGCLAFRGAPSASSYLAGIAGWQAMIGFPWRDLQATAVGTDLIQTPVT